MAEPRAPASDPDRAATFAILADARGAVPAADARRAAVLAEDPARHLARASSGRSRQASISATTSRRSAIPPCIAISSTRSSSRRRRRSASTALGALAGYVFAKLPFRGSDALFLTVVAGMFFPPQVILVPLFRLFNFFGLIDTLWPIFIVHTAPRRADLHAADAQLLRHGAERAARGGDPGGRERMGRC